MKPRYSMTEKERDSFDQGHAIGMKTGLANAKEHAFARGFWWGAISFTVCFVVLNYLVGG
jgi:hypothetical protein